MKLYKYFFVLFLIGCNRELPEAKLVSIDPIFQTYVNTFVDDGSTLGYTIIIDNLSLHFGSDLDDDVIGYCWTRTNHTPIIVISFEYWPNLSVYERKALLYHELGHCVLNRDHDSRMTYTNGYYIPKSIMYPYIQNELTYSLNWSYYINELFTGM